MAADNFEHCLALTLQFEGGYVDNPHDPGGATNLGITRAVLAQVRGRPVARSEVMALSREEARGIYRRLYWNTIAGDALPKGVDAVLFDLSVNSGPQHAIHALQTALGQPLSGRIDNPTLSALAKCVPATLVTAICRQRLSFLARLKTFSFFGRGWSRRVQSIERAGLDMLADVPVAKPAPPKAVPNPPGQGIHPKGKPVDTNIPANTEVSKPFWASQTIWSSFGVIGSSLAGVVLAWKGGDINALGASLTAMLGGVSAVVGRYRAPTKISRRGAPVPKPERQRRSGFMHSGHFIHFLFRCGTVGIPMRWGPSLITGFVLLAGSASLASAAGEPAAARACFASAEARDAIAQNHLINSTIAMRNAAIKLQGEALAGKLCRWTEQFVYEITLLRRDGRVIHAFIDARTGEVVGAQNNN